MLPGWFFHSNLYGIANKHQVGHVSVSQGIRYTLSVCPMRGHNERTRPPVGYSYVLCVSSLSFFRDSPGCVPSSELKV